MSDLTGKTILITGAAGRIGSAVAQLACKSGADVILSDISRERLFKLEYDLKSYCSNKIYSVESDVTSLEGIDNLMSLSLCLVNQISSAVHCAYPRSSGWGTPFEDLKEEYLYQDLSMQLGSAILFSQQILAYFNSKGGGDLVHISSIQGVRAPKFDHYEGTGMTSPIEYAAIKSGIISITSWLAKYHANKNIRVNCISPGGIADGQDPVFVKRYRDTCTNIGMLTAHHVATTIVYLLSADSASINGQNIIVDDGWSL